MKILCSISYNPTLNISSGTFGADEIVAIPRASDWGKTGPSKYLFYLRESLKIMWQARHYDAVVLCTVGVEAFFAGKLGRFICPHTPIICADFLMPRESRLVRAASSWLKGINAFLCIRSGDIPVLSRRFAISPEKCHFTYFPANLPLSELEVREGDYIYSGGWAHRDWLTLIEALSRLPYRAILSIGVPVIVPEHAQDRITVLPMQTPEAGRKLMAAAKIVVLSLEDTELPSGPLVLLDAMAMGKPVIATEVNGSRDYIRNEQTAIMVPPEDPAVLMAAIQSLMEDAARRIALGRSGRDAVIEQFTVDAFVRSVATLCARRSDVGNAFN